MGKNADRLTVRVGERADVLVKRAAKETEAVGWKISVSAVIRNALDAYLCDQTPGDPGVLRELAQAVKDLRADMGRVGANLNQLARYFNTHNIIQLNELATEHRELRRQLRALMTVLKRINGQLNDRKD